MRLKALTAATLAIVTTGCASNPNWVQGPGQSTAEFIAAKYVCAQESRTYPVYPPPRVFSQARTGPGGYQPGALTAGSQAMTAGIMANRERDKLYNLCMEAQGAAPEADK